MRQTFDLGKLVSHSDVIVLAKYEKSHSVELPVPKDRHGIESRPFSKSFYDFAVLEVLKNTTGEKIPRQISVAEASWEQYYEIEVSTAEGKKEDALYYYYQREEFLAIEEGGRLIIFLVKDSEGDFKFTAENAHETESKMAEAMEIISRQGN